MDFNDELMQVGVFSEEEASLLSGTVNNHTTQIQNLANSANTLNGKIDAVSGAVYTLDEWADKISDDLESLSGDVIEIVGGDYLTREELEEMGYLTESGASEIYQPITQFRTINGSAITGDNSDIEIYYDDTQVKADIQKLSGDIQTIVGGDFVTEDDLSAYTTVEYAENTYLKEVPASITNEIQSISAQVQTISGSYLTQDDLTPYATTAFTESTYLKEVPQSVMNDIQVVSGQVESLGNTVVSNSQNIQSLSGKINTISGNVQTISGDVETLQNTPFVQEGDDISVLINDAGYLLPSSLKTINKMSLIGNGDITIGTGETYDDTAINHRVDVVSGDVETLSNQVQSISGAIPTNLSDLTNDAGYLTKSSADTLYATQADLASVSGSLNDYLTESAASQTYQLKTQFRTINGNAITGDNTNIVISVPTKTSDLTNDSNFLTKSSADTLYATQADLASVSGDIPTNISDLTNDSGYITKASADTDYQPKTLFRTINNQAITGDTTNISIGGGGTYVAGNNIDITNDVISVTGISVPTKVSDLTNDSGYLTKASGDTIYQPIGNYLTKASADTLYATQADLQSVSGDIPTNVSDLTNDSGYLVASDLKTINNASIVGSGNIVVPQIWIGTQAQYEALPSYDNNTIYCIEKSS